MRLFIELEKMMLFEIKGRRDKIKMNIKLYFKWFDIWVGFYYDRHEKALYFQPLPLIGLKFQKSKNKYLVKE